MLAAEAAFGAIHEGLTMEAYWDNLKNSWVWEELRRARNFRPVSEAFLMSHCFNFIIYIFKDLPQFCFIFNTQFKLSNSLLSFPVEGQSQVITFCLSGFS